MENTKRVTEKTVTIQGRTFKIKAFDSMTGSYIAFTLFEKMMPMGMEDKVMKTLQAEGKNTELMLPESRSLMSKAEFFSFQRDCLSVCFEVLKGREAPVINQNGSWGVDGLEQNTMLVLLLTIHALVFNVADFFTDEGLLDLVDGLKTLSLANMPT